MADTDRIRAFFSVASCFAPAVSPEGDAVAYRVAGMETTALHLISMDTLETSRLVDNLPPINRDPLYWLPSGDRVVSVTGRQDTHEIELVSPNGQREHLVDLEGRVRLYDTESETVWYWAEEEQGYTLYRHPIDGHRSVITTLDPFNHGGGGIRGTRVVINRVEKGSIAPHILDTDTDAERRLSSSAEGWAAHFRSWIDDEHLLLTRWRTPGVGVYDIDADTFVWTDETIDQPVTALPNGDIFAVRDWTPVVGDASGWEEFPLDGAAVISPLAADELLLPDGRAIIPRKSSTRPRELLILDLDDGTTEPLVDADYGQIDPDDIVAPEAVTYPTVDGSEIDAYLWTPGGNGVFPTVVTMYPAQPDPTPGLDWHIQLLVDAGYAVLWAGHRGDPIDAHIDYAAAGRWVSDRTDLDGDRVAFYGHSAGGGAALRQAFRHPDVWSAVINWAGRFDTMWAFEAGHLSSPRMDEAFPNYEDDPRAWHDANPATHANDLDVPLLAIYGRSDPMIPLEHGRKLLNTFSKDVPLEYHELDAGHGGELDWEVTVWNIILEFLERRVEAAPSPP